MYKCAQEQHDKCENSSLCHLCDGNSLYKNTREEQIQKQQQRKQNKEDLKKAGFRVHKEEKKEGMAFEKAVQKKWNSAYNHKQKDTTSLKTLGTKKPVPKPRIQVEQVISPEPEPTQSEPKIILPLKAAAVNKMNDRPIIDAKRQANSGALWYAQGDIKTEHYLMECKERGTLTARGAKTISIPKDWLEKQEMEAFQEKRPYWVIPFRYKGDNSIYLVKSFDQEIEMYQELRRVKEELATLKAKVDIK